MSTTNEYLAAQVTTATPQRLHLMLIDGAIRFAQQAKQTWDDDTTRQTREEALTRCVKITGEMLACMRGSNLPSGKQFIAVYAWLFRTMTEAKLLGDRAKLDEALELLAIERETWQRVCEQFGVHHPSSGDLPSTVAHPTSRGGADAPLTGLSLEA